MKAKSDKPLRIVRGQHDSEHPYFVSPRATPQDRSLTWEARGLLWYLLSKPDTWEVQPSDLEQECGRDRVYRILNELIEHRYVVRVEVREKGRYVEGFYKVYESPLPENTDTAIPDAENTDIRELEKEPEKKESTFATVVAEESKAKKQEKDDTIPSTSMNPMKDAIAAVFHYDWQVMTATEKGVVQRVAKELCQAGRSPNDVETIFRYCQDQGWTAITPMVLSKHATAALNHNGGSRIKYSN